MFVVLFDIDGTLIQTGGAGKAAFAKTFVEDFTVQEFPEQVLFAGRSDRAIAEDIMLHVGIESSQENWSRFLAGYSRRLNESLMSRKGHVLPGVETLLEQLSQMEQVAVGLLTGNIERGARAKLRYYGLDHRFGFGGFGDASTDRNDIAADAVRAAKVHFSLTATNGESSFTGVMVIGDTVNDVRCAKSIEAYSVAVTTGGSTAEELQATEPDLLLEDLTEVSGILSHIRTSNHIDSDQTNRS